MTELQIYPFIEKRIEDYCEKNVSEEPDAFVKLNHKTHLSFVHPQMISGNWQGTFLRMISKMINPKSILEIGTFSGYSTLCLAEGLQKGGIIHTIEKEQEYEDFLIENFEKLSDKTIKLHIGRAIDVLKTIEGEFDLIFIDADKASYPEYYEICIDKLRPSGIIIADNILWYGKVGLSPMPSDKQTIAINQFNQRITNDPRVENVIIPIRDGLMMGRKL